MKGYFIQFVASSIISLANFTCSFLMVWPSYTIRIFESDKSPLNGDFTSYHGTLIGSLPMLGSFIGSLFGATIGDVIGRKKTEILNGLILVLSWALISTTTRINVLIAARFIGGLATGLHTGIFTIYVGEISEPAYRGSLATLPTFGYASGILGSYVMGWFCSYNVINYTALSLSVLFVCLTSFLKETPSYLLQNGYEKEALKSLKFYRGLSETTKELKTEFEDMKLLSNGIQQTKGDQNSTTDPEKESLQNNNTMYKNIKKRNAWKQLWSSKSSRRGTILTTTLLTLLAFMGMIAVQTYAGTMFAAAVPTLSADMCSIALAVATLFGNGIALIIADILGRRVLMISSSTSVALCLASIAILLRWPIAPDWVFPVMMLMYCFCLQLGVGCVPFMSISEYFVPEVRTLASTTILSAMWLANFVMLAVFGAAVDAVGLDIMFFIFSLIATLSAIISYVFLPETSGMTIADIQVLLGSQLVHFRKQNK